MLEVRAGLPREEVEEAPAVLIVLASPEGRSSVDGRGVGEIVDECAVSALPAYVFPVVRDGLSPRGWGIIPLRHR